MITKTKKKTNGSSNKPHHDCIWHSQTKRKQQQQTLSEMPFKSNKPFNLYKQTIAAKQILARTDLLLLFFFRSLFRCFKTNVDFIKYMTNGYGVQ